MSAFKDSGHHWWQQCQQCRQAWFVGQKPDDVDEDVTCPRCDAEDLRVIAAREEGRAEGFAAAREMAQHGLKALVTTYEVGDPGRTAAELALERIRAMQDGRADVVGGEANFCGCAHSSQSWNGLCQVPVLTPGGSISPCGCRHQRHAMRDGRAGEVCRCPTTKHLASCPLEAP